MCFLCCLLDVVKRLHVDHPSKSDPSQTAFLALHSASFLWPVYHISKPHLPPWEVMVSSYTCVLTCQISYNVILVPNQSSCFFVVFVPVHLSLRACRCSYEDIPPSVLLLLDISKPYIFQRWDTPSQPKCWFTLPLEATVMKCEMLHSNSSPQMSNPTLVLKMATWFCDHVTHRTPALPLPFMDKYHQHFVTISKW